MDVPTALGYLTTAAFARLFYLQFRSSSVWLVPSFTALCALIVINGLTWSKLNHEQFFIMQPLLLSLQFCSVSEVLILVVLRVSISEAKGLLLLLTGLGFSGGCISSLMFQHVTSPMIAYRLARLTIHTGLSMVSVFGLLALSLRPPRLTLPEKTHAVILTIYLLKFTVIEFIRGTATADDASYARLQLTSLLWSLVCCCAWLRWGRIVQKHTTRASREHSLNII